MAAKSLFRGMVDQGDVAILALFSRATIETQDRCRKPAPVEKKNGLPTIGQCVGDRAAQRGGENDLAAVGAALLAEVDDLDGRQRAATDALG